MQYILLINVSPEGLDAIERDPLLPLKIDQNVEMPGASALGIYGVLGPYDYVAILEAPDNDVAARWSLTFGSRLKANVTTMPAVPMSHFDHGREEAMAESVEQPVGSEPVGRA